MAENQPTAKEKIREIRKAWGMTQRTFGVEVGKSERSIQDYETGKTPVPVNLEKLIDYIAKEREAAIDAS